MLNYIWLGLMMLAVIIGGWNNQLDAVIKGGFDMAKTAVMDIALPLSAIMTIWLGVMRVAEKAGLVALLARAVRPVLRKLFPDVPANHPAMGSMVMNIAANMLGLGNAATPLGLRAMSELQKLNPHPGTATNAMCTFLAINTASIQLIPATAVGILAVAGGKNPTAIVGTAFLATVFSQIVGLTAVKTLEKLPMFRAQPDSGEKIAAAATPATPAAAPTAVETVAPPPLTAGGKIVLALFGLFFAYVFVALICPEVDVALREKIGSAIQSISPALKIGSSPFVQTGSTPENIFTRAVKSISLLAIPFFLSFFPLYAALRKIKVYEEFVEGAKEGFQVAVRIIPYLVTILAAIGMFRNAGGIALLGMLLSPILTLVHFPTELLSLAFMRPLSGSGSLSLFSDIVKTFGPNHINSLMAATMYGSTETTFYVVAVYFGSVGIRRTRHAIAAGLLADLAGITASVIICRLVFT